MHIIFLFFNADFKILHCLLVMLIMISVHFYIQFLGWSPERLKAQLSHITV